MLAASERHGWARFVSMQPQLNLVYREEEREMLPLCKAEGVGVIPWSPLARGYLAGGRSAPMQGATERSRTDDFSAHMYYRQADQDVVTALSEVAAARSLPNTQVALAWVAANSAVTAPIIGASKLDHIKDAVAGLEVELTTEEIAKLEAPYQPKPVLDHG
jgi:aryl-alcohol dehydrogenase (NADP+)